MTNMIDDIYGDLDDFDVGQSLNELQEKNNKLTAHIDELTLSLSKVTKEVEAVKKINDTLQKNISKIFNTAKAEFERKTRMINELRKELDDLVFRRRDVKSYKIPKRRLEERIDQNDDAPIAKKPKMNPVDEKPIEIKGNKDIDKHSKHNPIHSHRNGHSRYKKFNRDRARSRTFRRSRSPSRDRKRRTPPRSTYRRKSRDSYDKNNSNRRNYSPDEERSEPRIYENEKKSFVDNFKRREHERSDSESVISVNSNSSIEEIPIKHIKKDYISRRRDEMKEKSYSRDKRPSKHSDTEKLLSKVSKHVVKLIEKIEENTYSEIEEGECSDADSEFILSKDQDTVSQKIILDEITSDSEILSEKSQNNSVLNTSFISEEKDIDFEEMITKNNIELIQTDKKGYTKITKENKNDSRTYDAVVEKINKTEPINELILTINKPYTKITKENKNNSQTYDANVVKINKTEPINELILTNNKPCTKITKEKKNDSQTYDANVVKINKTEPINELILTNNKPFTIMTKEIKSDPQTKINDLNNTKKVENVFSETNNANVEKINKPESRNELIQIDKKERTKIIKETKKELQTKIVDKNNIEKIKIDFNQTHTIEKINKPEPIKELLKTDKKECTEITKETKNEPQTNIIDTNNIKNIQDFNEPDNATVEEINKPKPIKDNTDLEINELEEIKKFINSDIKTESLENNKEIPQKIESTLSETTKENIPNTSVINSSLDSTNSPEKKKRRRRCILTIK